MKLVIDTDRGGLFEEDHWCDIFQVGTELKEKIQGKKIEKALILDNPVAMQILQNENISCSFLDPAKFSHLEVSFSAKAMIANIFGALYHFPSNDCVVVDIGPAIEVAYIGKNGKYFGGLSCPAMKIENKPSEVLSDNVEKKSRAGSYYGTLGAIERMVAEARFAGPLSESVLVVATGMRVEQTDFIHDLSEFIDRVDPHLRLVGLREIMNL